MKNGLLTTERNLCITGFPKLAKYVKAKCKEFDLTQVDLSHKSGVGLRFVREMEQGKETLRLDKVNQVFALFGAEMAPMKTSEIQ